MHGRSWIRDQRLAEAVKLRERIALLQRELTEKASCAVGMFKMAQLGQQLRWQKFRLALLEDCISNLSDPDCPRHVSLVDVPADPACDKGSARDQGIKDQRKSRPVWDREGPGVAR